MNLPHDMKNYRPDAFQLFTEEEAGWLFALALVVCALFDLWERLS